MAHITGTLADFADAFDKFKALVCGEVSQSYIGTGNGIMDRLNPMPSIVTEVWTITATSPTVFSVTGSVTGATANANVDTDYDNGFIRFRINSGGTPFVAADEFTVTAVASPLGGLTWECLKDSSIGDDFADAANCTGGNFVDETNGPFDRMAYFRSKGSGGTDNIYYILTSFHNSTVFFNLELRCCTSVNFVTFRHIQPGVSPAHFIPLTDAPATNDYWMDANGRRAWMAFKIGTTSYECGYFGWGFPTGDPDEVPLPYVVGGSHTKSDGVPAGTVNGHRAFFAPEYTASEGRATLSVRATTGAWLPVYAYTSAASTAISEGSIETSVYPLMSVHSERISQDQRRPQGHCYGNTDRVIRPISLFGQEPGFKGSYGDLDGVFWVSGEGLNAEDTLNAGDYVVLRSTTYTQRDHYAAFFLS